MILPILIRKFSMISTASGAIWVSFFSVLDLKIISFRIRTVHNPSLLFKSSREGGNITHFAKLLSKIDRDENFFETFNFNYYTSDSL